MKFPGEKLIIKLWDTLADNGIGSLLKPWQIRREAEAQADSLLVISQAEKLAQEIRDGEKQVILNSKYPIIDSRGSSQPEHYSQLSRAITDLSNDIIRERVRKEINISKAILEAEEELKQKSQAPPEKSIDDDWLFTWRENTGKCSNEYMQALWGKVLAGELLSPRQYSFRTLDFLRTLSVDDAKFIEEKFAFVINRRIIIENPELLRKYKFTFEDRLKLQELGLVSGAEGTLSVTYNKIPQLSPIDLISYNKNLRLIPIKPESKVKYKQCLLTTLGNEISLIGEFQPNEEYLNYIARSAVSNGFRVIEYDHDLTTHMLTNGVEF